MWWSCTPPCHLADLGNLFWCVDSNLIHQSIAPETHVLRRSRCNKCRLLGRRSPCWRCIHSTPYLAVVVRPLRLSGNIVSISIYPLAQSLLYALQSFSLSHIN